MPEPETEYLMMHYGICKLTPCLCRRDKIPVEINYLCPQWQPNGAKTWNELAEKMKELYDKCS